MIIEMRWEKMFNIKPFRLSATATYHRMTENTLGNEHARAWARCNCSTDSPAKKAAWMHTLNGARVLPVVNGNDSYTSCALRQTGFRLMILFRIKTGYHYG